eukprot:c952_g1_i1.p1 GENE.c952_g1_i1~~c952_g1_i1.p1  ORF type:complete len:798 (-),score=170.57 c952_g1_i1:105-2498(-)
MGAKFQSLADRPADMEPGNDESWIDDQEKFKLQAQEVVKQQAYFMKRALDSNNLSEALKHSSTMICELRTSLLTPKHYYELYIQVCDQLRHLEMFFEQESKRGRAIHELYQLVQHAGNVLPRLYLLVTVGAVYIRSKEVAAKEILRDLVEMCKGVQHPLRGLFLRNYLSQMTKDKLPDVGNEYESDGDSTLETIDFVILNFVEMNKLWVRMQHQGPVRERDKREKERLDLRILVGTNLVRLSQLDGVTLDMYKEKVLPRVLEQVINCKDQIAQEYLMEVIIQVFPDEFHLHTLEPFLHTCTELQSGVDVKTIFISMADRLAKFAQSNPEGIPEHVKIFNTFTKYVAKLIQNQTSMELKDILSLQVALLNFAIKCYPDRLDYVDHVLAFCSQLLSKLGTKKLDKAGVAHIVKLLLLPLDAYKNILVVLDLTNFADLMSFLDRPTRKTVALSIVKNMIENNTQVSDVDKVEKLYNFIMPLLKDAGEDEPQAEADESEEDMAEEQRYIARLVHLYQSPNTDDLFQIYLLSRKYYGKGGTKRIKFTLPSLIFRALRLAIRIQNEEKQVQVPVRQVFKFVHESLAVLQPHAPEITLRLHLQAAQAADICGAETIAYEFVTQAFTAYEDELGADSKAQYAALQVIVATLQSTKCFTEENRDTLMTKAAQYSAKVMKRTDQSIAVARVSHLFWGYKEADNKDNRRCLECLQRALNCGKEAVTSSASNLLIYVEILNEYLYFFEKQNSDISVKYISGLIALIKSQLDEAVVDEHTRTFFRNTCAHIKHVASSPGENAARYQEIVL